MAPQPAARSARRLGREQDSASAFEMGRCNALRLLRPTGFNGQRRHRFEKWNERRSLALPYFLRSTTRLSRVRKPPRLSTLRNSGSKFVSALERPWRTAPAWPDNPPPDTRQMTSYWPLRLAIASGWPSIMRSAGRAKNTSISRLLTVILPVPRLIQTRATAFLRLPVA